MHFELHPQLAADTVTVGDLPLSRVLLMNDSRYPWIILVPRRAGLRELYELHEADLQRFWRESVLLSRTLMATHHGDKLNIAALGNMVPQLHVHHVVRYTTDAAWPAPVWGKHPALHYTADALAQQVGLLRSALGPDLQPQPGAAAGPALA